MYIYYIRYSQLGQICVSTFWQDDLENICFKYNFLKLIYANISDCFECLGGSCVAGKDMVGVIRVIILNTSSHMKFIALLDTLRRAFD